MLEQKSTASYAFTIKNVRSQLRYRRLAYWSFFMVPLLFQLILATYIWSRHQDQVLTGTTEHVLFYLKFVWFLPALWALFNFVGLLKGAPDDGALAEATPDHGDVPAFKLIVAYVSRGMNRLALERSMRQTQAVLDAMGVHYELEAVTDIEIPPDHRILPTRGPVYYELVPEAYVTAQGVKYKARALQYLLERRSERLAGQEAEGRGVADTWVFHCDEESVLTREVVEGIRRFIASYSLQKGPGAIGQGEIHYNAYNYGENTLITAMDSIRTGDDLGRFRLQYQAFKKPLFGMHGSFVLVPAVVEAQIGWDWGSKSDITEDTYFAFKAMEAGVTFDWVQGFIREQSPFSINDIIKQRARWYTGLSLIVSERKIRPLYRLSLALFVLAWTFAWIGCIVTIASLFATLFSLDNYFPLWATLISATIAGVFGAAYMVGAYRNTSFSPLPLRRRAGIIAATYVLWFTQIVPLVETIAVLYAFYRALFNPISTFHVVEKDTVVVGADG